MKLSKKLLAAAMTVGALSAGPAQAVAITGVNTAAGNTVVDYSTLGNVSFDLDLVRFAPGTTLTFTLENGDGSVLDFDAIIRNLTLSTGIGHMKLVLFDATFQSFGTAVGFSGAGKVSGSQTTGIIDFTPPEFVDITIGDVGFGGTDWKIDVANLGVGDTFSMRVAVPEPGSLALLLGGLGAALTLRRRSSRRT